MNLNLYGIDFNTMTSAALTNYGAKLKKRMVELNEKKETKTITKDEKKELEASAQILDVVASQNKRLIQIDSKLKKLGINLGSIKDFSYNSLSRQAIEAIDKEIAKSTSVDRNNKLTDLKKKLGGSQYMNKGKAAFNIVEDTFKVAGTGLATTSAGMVVFNAAKAIGDIQIKAATETKFFNSTGSEITEKEYNALKEKGLNPTMEEGTSAETVKSWIGDNMSWLNSAVGLAVAAGACFFIAKKMKEYKNAKNLAYAGAQEEQLKAEDAAVKAQKENKAVSIETEAARAETDIVYLDTLRANLGGKTVKDILKEGPSGKYSAAQYNAARILSVVELRANENKKLLAQMKLQESNLNTEITNLQAEIPAIDSVIGTKEGAATSLRTENSNLEVRKSWLTVNLPDDNTTINPDNPQTERLLNAIFGKGKWDRTKAATLTNKQLKASQETANNTLQAKIEENKKKIKKLENEIEELNKEKKSKKSDLDKKQSDLNQLKAQQAGM